MTDGFSKVLGEVKEVAVGTVERPPTPRYEGGLAGLAKQTKDVLIGTREKNTDAGPQLKPFKGNPITAEIKAAEQVRATHEKQRLEALTPTVVPTLESLANPGGPKHDTAVDTLLKGQKRENKEKKMIE